MHLLQWAMFPTLWTVWRKDVWSWNAMVSHLTAPENNLVYHHCYACGTDSSDSISQFSIISWQTMQKTLTWAMIFFLCVCVCVCVCVCLFRSRDDSSETVPSTSSQRDWLSSSFIFSRLETVTPTTWFLDECLVPRTKFANSSAEKAWSKFHAACFEQIPGTAKNLKLSSDVSYHVCLKILQKHVHLNYCSTQSTTSKTSNTASTPVSVREKNILHSIRGCIYIYIYIYYNMKNWKQSTQTEGNESVTQMHTYSVVINSIMSYC